jgi:hypothetical protein
VPEISSLLEFTSPIIPANKLLIRCVCINGEALVSTYKQGRDKILSIIIESLMVTGTFCGGEFSNLSLKDAEISSL